MLLRSSSTPLLGSLLSSVPESPNNNHHESKHVQHHSSYNKPPLPHSGSLHFSTFSGNSSPSAAEVSQKGVRRARSVGNLDTLAQASCAEDDDHNDQLFSSAQSKKFSAKYTRYLMLETIPSFSHHGSGKRYEEEEDSDIEDGSEEWLENNFGDGKRAMAVQGRTMSLEKKMSNVLSREEVKDSHHGLQEDRETGNEEMFLARGLGIGCETGGGGGDGGNCNSGRSGGDSRDDGNVEEYYKKMVEENPGNPLFLRNYAQFLYETKHDVQKAEEYYSRAILADPRDGEILAQYAKLAWELHHDQDRASSYFERAVKASPEDSHVHAAYASFLWEIDEEEDEENFTRVLNASPTQICNKGHVTPIGA